MRFFWIAPLLPTFALGKQGVRKGDGRGLGVLEKKTETLDVILINASFQQPFSGLFVMVSDGTTEPVCPLGSPASPELQDLAENGDPQKLVDKYTNATGVSQVMAVEGPTGGGVADAKRHFQVDVSDKYPYLTVAAMLVNTNDAIICGEFIDIADVPYYPLPALDAGTEENNELCSSIPGPACAETDTNNEASGNGEGIIHVHRGFIGVADDLTSQGYTWLNPTAVLVNGGKATETMSEEAPATPGGEGAAGEGASGEGAAGEGASSVP